MRIVFKQYSNRIIQSCYIALQRTYLLLCTVACLLKFVLSNLQVQCNILFNYYGCYCLLLIELESSWNLSFVLVAGMCECMACGSLSTVCNKHDCFWFADSLFSLNNALNFLILNSAMKLQYHIHNLLALARGTFNITLAANN